MSGPGEYVPDGTEGITRVEDLPKAKLADFSGYIAADELYDGPFCVLSIVDNRTFRRITYEVLDHDPTLTDAVAFRAYMDEVVAHGCNGVFMHVTNQWFKAHVPSHDRHDGQNPDLETFAALERGIVAAHRRGLYMHIWAWGDESRKWTPIGVGGINGQPDRRIQRYIAARLAARLDDGLWIRSAGVDRRSRFAGLGRISARPHLYEERHTYLRNDDLSMAGTRRFRWAMAMAGGMMGFWGNYPIHTSPTRCRSNCGLTTSSSTADAASGWTWSVWTA